MVLVTELTMVPPSTENELPREATAAEQWAAGHAGRREARLTVGVLRDGHYACCLQLRGEEDLLVRNDIAVDLVTALLGTF